MQRRDLELRLALAKLLTFAVVAVGVTLTIAATIRPFNFGGTSSYDAIFSSSSGLKAGDDVRASGVPVGHVDDVALLHDNTVKVRFTLDHQVDLTTGTHAEIHYLDLIGDRTVTLLPGTGAQLPDGSTIPINQTRPALDLNLLFNGFRPLFTALSPDDINALSGDLIQAFQGEGVTVTDIIHKTAELTNSIADRNVMVGQVIDNLTALLGTIDDRQGRLDQLVSALARFTRGAAQDHVALGTAIDHVSQLTDMTSQLLAEARPGLKGSIAQLDRLTRGLDTSANRSVLDELLTKFPNKVAAISRTASYGSFFNYYACTLSVKFTGSLPAVPTPAGGTGGSGLPLPLPGGGTGGLGGLPIPLPSVPALGGLGNLLGGGSSPAPSSSPTPLLGGLGGVLRSNVAPASDRVVSNARSNVRTATYVMAIAAGAVANPLDILSSFGGITLTDGSTRCNG